MVVRAVICEPVSDAYSLLSGKLTGNFAFLGWFERHQTQETPALQAFLEPFPNGLIREFLLR
jgi:hypothetical protein